MAIKDVLETLAVPDRECPECHAVGRLVLVRGGLVSEAVVRAGWVERGSGYIERRDSRANYATCGRCGWTEELMASRRAA